MDILSADRDKCSLDNADFHGDDSKTIIHVPLLSLRNKLEQRKVFKKEIRKKIMPVAWNSAI